MKDWENQLSLDVKLADLDKKTLNEQVFLALKKRLSYEAPYMPLWQDAIWLGAMPQNLPTTYNRLFSTMNTVWDMLGDNSTGLNWYAKRALIGQIFVSTEMTMIHDGSSGFAQTWEFLHRQLEDQNFDNVQDLGYLWYKYAKSVLR
jgi:ubiquinone biosynthesis protein COQ9